MREVPAPVSGRLERVDTRALGRLVQALGGGRLRADDIIDPAVGLAGLPSLGESFQAGAPVATIHADSETNAERAEQALLNALIFNEDSTRSFEPPALVLDRLVPATQTGDSA